jgi:hypothetical protein
MNTLHPFQNLDGHFNTISGIKFSIFDPKPEQIYIQDIAHGLSYNSHFGGQTPEFFSITQHCLLVVSLLPKDADIELKLMALMHDAAEAYIGDMIKPLKVHFPKFKEIEDRIMEAIAAKFGLNLDYMKDVKEYDIKAQEIEYRAFYEKSIDMDYLCPDAALHTFIRKFAILINSK